MIRRNIIIVDDMPTLAANVNTIINNYYTTKREYNFDIKLFVSDTPYRDAKEYINDKINDIDIIFSDQNLGDGYGIDLFREAIRTVHTEYKSILCHMHIYRIMHSSEDRRLKEHQSDHLKLYHYFVNSLDDAEKDIEEFLEFYEKKIVSTRTSGNPTYHEWLYEYPALQKATTKTIEVDGKLISLRNILLFVMDKNTGNSDYYHCIYDDGEKIQRTQVSKKFSIISSLKGLQYFTGNLREGLKEKFSINPLWIAGLDKQNSKIKLISKYNILYEIQYEKLTGNEELLSRNIDSFFYR
jgi:hypothetical protein